MKMIDRTIMCKGRGDTFSLYVLGDCHIGNRNCAESHIRRLVKKIALDKRAYWIGGGDYCECIAPQDIRFSHDTLPDWILSGDADTTRGKLRDITSQQVNRFVEMTSGISTQCLGLVEGNHERKIRIRDNVDVQARLCRKLGVSDLTGSAFIRLKFKRGGSGIVIKIFITHGMGGGRTAGAEPNHLQKLCNFIDADIILRGHSHTFIIAEPKAMLSVPSVGALPKELIAKYKRSANWGCWVRSYATGPSTYDEVANYPARSLSTVEITMQPHKSTTHGSARPGEISMKELTV